MTMPDGIGAIDLMIGFPTADFTRHYDGLRAMAKDAASKDFAFPAQYLFAGAADLYRGDVDPIEATLNEMDRFGVAAGMIGDPGSEITQRALREHPKRFFASVGVDPNDITGAVRSIRAAKDEWDVKAVTSFPAGCNPQVPISDRRYYPIYQVCIDLGLPIVLNTGIPGPRVPAACQDVMHVDQVCYDFPELVLVMCHGSEPWEALAVKLMLKWPGLHYMPSAFAPKHYPKAIIEYANRRGADKIMYAGYFPMGLTLERIFGELRDVPFRDDVWPKFLRDNAVRVFGLDL
jgi:hypothetical protein